jgi:hypothetical protein
MVAPSEPAPDLTGGTDLTTPIAGYDFVNDVNAYNGVGDGRYALVNNISPRSDPIRDCATDA